jgi:archaellum component FlaG (FlaF/FlaG flagellin family)
MKNLKWLFAFSLPVLMFSCQKGAVNTSKTEEVVTSVSTTGNGGPSGPHYQVNIIGKPKSKTADMTGDNGRRIFVNDYGTTKIMLSEGEFAVLDANGTDGSASFQLPDPADGSDPVTGTSYSVYVRALGKPGGKVGITTCATIVDGVDTYTGIICSQEVLQVERTTGKSKFTDVSRYLLTMYVDITNDGISNPKRYNLFDAALQDYYWNYDNNGLKVLQMRFYEIPSTLPL